MGGTSPDGKAQLKQETFRPDGRLLHQMEGPFPQTGGHRANRRPQPRRQASVQTRGTSPDSRNPSHIGGLSAQKMVLGGLAPRQEALSPSGRPLRWEGRPKSRRETPHTRWEAPLPAQAETPTRRPAQTEDSQPRQEAYPRREAPAQTESPQPKRKAISPNGRPSALDGRPPAHTEPRREAAAQTGASSAQTGGPPPK